MKAAGIIHPRHLFSFDHRAFWQERLRLYRLDPGRLGRLYRNRQQGTRSHLITERDRTVGAKIIGRYDTIQELLDGIGGGRIGHALTRLSAEPFLPSRGETTLYLLYTNPNNDNYDRPDNIRCPKPQLPKNPTAR